jgi:CXXC-20-CXXC protein
MKARTCPNCGYKYSFWLHLRKHFFQNVFSAWECRNCGAKLVVDARRRILLAVVGILPAAALPILTDFFMGYYLGRPVSLSVSVVLVTIWATFIFSLDHFYLAEGERLNREKEQA